VDDREEDGVKKLLSPEENPGYDPETHAPPVSLYAKTRQPGSTIQVPVLAYILIAVALLLLAAGFFVADNAITQTAAFAAAAVVALSATKNPAARSSRATAIRI